MLAFMLFATTSGLLQTCCPRAGAAPSLPLSIEQPPAPETFRIMVDSLNLRAFLRHQRATHRGIGSGSSPVLFLHGSSFPSALEAAFPLDGVSWMDDMASRGFDVWALDFAGFGGSDRYPEMRDEPMAHPPLGRAPVAAQQILAAVQFIVARTKQSRVSLVAHSWATIPAGLAAGNAPSLIDRLVDFGPIAQRNWKPDTTRLAAFDFATDSEQFVQFNRDVPRGQAPVFSSRDFASWGPAFLATDSTSRTRRPASIQVPNGPSADVLEAWTGHLPYDPARIVAPVLIIRGEWDMTARDADAVWLWNALTASAFKRDVKVSHATHEMELEPARRQLYTEVAAFLAEAPAPVSPPTRNAPDAELVIQHVNVVDVERGAIQPDRDVIVRGTRIVAVTAAGKTKIPPGATVVNASGKFVIPGLWDMHVHVWDRPIAEPLLLAYGVTGVRDMGASVPPILYRWQREVRAGQAVGPRIVTAGKILDGPDPFWPAISIPVATYEEGVNAVDSTVRAGGEFVKIYTKLSPRALQGIADAAKHHHVMMAGHDPDQVSLASLADMGVRSVEHYDGIELACSAREAELRDSLARLMVGTKSWADYSPARGRITALARQSRDPARCRATFAMLARNGVFWTPTLVQGRAAINIADSTLLAGLPLQFVRPGTYWLGSLHAQSATTVASEAAHLQQQLDDFGEMHVAGVRFLAGTDLGYPGTVPGASLHDELGLLVRAGLSPLEALRSATLNPALYFNARDSLGTVARGQVADLAILDGNPLADIANTRAIFAVVVNGHPFERAALDSLRSAAARAAQRPGPQ